VKAPLLLSLADADQFLRSFASCQATAYEVNWVNGWWDARANIIATEMPGAKEAVVLSCLGLITSEVAEAMEAVRKHPVETWHDAKTKDTLVRELAGTVVRCMDLAERLSLPLGDAIIEEITANAERGYMHGGKKA